MMKHYDAIVIGAGQAGVPLAKKLALAGKKTALIEKRLVGGTCINDGCTPTKALVASAKMAYQAQHAAALGVDVANFKVNFKNIMQRKDDIVKQFRAGAQKGIDTTKGLKLFMGEAKFTDEKEITITAADGKQEVLTADLIFINTGAETFIPPIEGLEDIDFLTSTTILELKEVPTHLVVIGGNYLGLEFAQMFKRFGSEVTVVERAATIIANEDDDISASLTEIFEAENIEVLTHAEATAFAKTSKGEIQIDLKVGNKTRTIKASHVLVAVGRRPQTEHLGLAACGVKTDEKGNILVNAKLETNVKGIFALGDVKGGPAFTHIAYNDYTIVYRNLTAGAKLTITNRPVPYCMFTDPQLGRIGISEKEATAQKLNYKVATFPMAHSGRAIEMNETKGLMKAIVDVKTKKILGASILSAEGGEVVTVLQMAMEGGITYDEIRYGTFAHPTYSESLNNLFMTLD